MQTKRRNRFWYWFWRIICSLHCYVHHRNNSRFRINVIQHLFVSLKKTLSSERALKKSLKRKSLFLSASFKNGLFSAMSLISVAANAFLGASLEPLPSLRSVQGLKLLANPLEVVASTPINW